MSTKGSSEMAGDLAKLRDSCPCIGVCEHKKMCGNRWSPGGSLVDPSSIRGAMLDEDEYDRFHPPFIVKPRKETGDPKCTLFCSIGIAYGFHLVFK